MMVVISEIYILNYKDDVTFAFGLLTKFLKKKQWLLHYPWNFQKRHNTTTLTTICMMAQCSPLYS